MSIDKYTLDNSLFLKNVNFLYTKYIGEHLIGLVGRVFANGLVDRGSIPGRVMIKTFKKMVLDTSLLNAQHDKVHIKGKVEQSRERSNALPYTPV